MNHKIKAIFLIIVTTFTLYANNYQKVHPFDSLVYDAIVNLYISNGLALPSTSAPFSSDELLKMVDKLDYDSLNEDAKLTYNYVLKELNQKDRSFKFEINVALEANIHTNNENFIKPDDWIRNYNERSQFAELNLETWPSKNIYGYISFLFGNSKYTNFSEDQREISYYYGQKLLTHNLFFLYDTDDATNPDDAWPYRAFGSFGGNNWSVQIGRDRLSWGPGITGNFMLGDHLSYHNMGRLSAYRNNFKYTLVTSFFPHPAQYYPIMDETGKFLKDTEEFLDGINMFLGHRIEWSLFSNRVGFALSEAIMYQSKENYLDLRILNPSMVYHNYYISNNANSLLTLEVNTSPYKWINLYGQLAIDEFALPTESQPGIDSSANPSAHAFMVGAKTSYPINSGFVYGSFEWVYTNPYIYLRGKTGNQGDSEYGINYVVAIREQFRSSRVFDEQFLGYKYGPDAIVYNLNGGYKKYGKWFVEGNLFYMVHGTHDKGTQWSTVGTSVDYLKTPTTKHETNNNRDINAHIDRDSVSKTFVVGLKGEYQFPFGISLFAQGDYIFIANKDNRKSTLPVNDFQFSFAISYKY